MVDFKTRLCRVCHWRESDEGWEGDCGIFFVLIDGTPADNEMVYCPRCGKIIDDREEEAADGEKEVRIRRSDV